MVTTGFAETVAERISAEHALLAARWFARLHDLLPVDANEVFPTDKLLDHIPSLVVDISEYLRAPEEQAIAANTVVVEKARELGALRHQQRASLHQVLREYQLLAGILVRFVQDEAIRLLLTPSAEECIETVSKLYQAVAVLQQETVETFVRLYTETITEQSERLQQFTRMATHEWRQPLAPIVTAVSLLRFPGLDDAQRAQTIELIARNVTSLVDMTHKLERLARLDGAHDTPSVQHIPIRTVVAEAARQVRDMAEARGVEIHIASEMPTTAVDVGRLELALVNLLSNAIKYCDANKPVRMVEITAHEASNGDCEIRVRDNGVGIPKSRVGGIFRRFARAHADHADLDSIKGVGLGLAIVDDCMNAVGGSIIVESEEGVGTIFTMTFPCDPALAAVDRRTAAESGNV